MFWDILDEPRRLLLKKLVVHDPVPGAYLAGGTALALLFGHRESVDFDWFSPDPFSPERLQERLAELGEVQVAETTRGTFHGWVNGINVTWLHYPNPMLQDFWGDADLPALRIASPTDIALMKWAALSDRGALKDFIDLYELGRCGLPLSALFPHLEKKFPHRRLNLYHMVKSLVFFDDAKGDTWPVMRRPLDWKELESFFRREQALLMPLLLENGKN